MGAGLRARLRPAAVRPLGHGSASTVAEVLGRDPVGTCMVTSRFEADGMDAAAIGGTFWGTADGAGALCFAGANLIPLAGDSASWAAVARALQPRGRRSASIVGRAELALPLWEHLRGSWGVAREVRDDQPLLVCPDAPPVRADSRVTRVGSSHLAEYFPAAVAMFTEEVGVDPTAADHGRSYRSRIAGLLSAGSAFAILDGRTVIYKAEIGALSQRVALIQGVWVHPDWRGQGIAAPATAAVVREIHRLGRLPSLYVNAHNIAARATYARLGFHQVGTFASVLF